MSRVIALFTVDGLWKPAAFMNETEKTFFKSVSKRVWRPVVFIMGYYINSSSYLNETESGRIVWDIAVGYEPLTGGYGMDINMKRYRDGAHLILDMRANMIRLKQNAMKYNPDGGPDPVCAILFDVWITVC